MPLVGFACPPGSPTFGERHAAEYCLRGCPHPCVSPPLLKAIYDADRGNYHQGEYISASMLAGTGCARKTVYERTEDFYEFPVNRWWAFRGTIAHALIEAAGEDLLAYGWLQELRMAVPLTYPDLPAPIMVEGRFTGRYDPSRPLVIWVRGTTDAYNPLLRELHDFKSMADAKALMMVQGEKPGTFSDQLSDAWVWQTNIYGWLLGQTRPTPEVAALFGLSPDQPFPRPDRLMIQGFSMMHLVRAGYDVEIKVKRGRYNERVCFTVDPVPVLSDAEVEAFVRPRALEWYRYLVLGERAPVVDEDLKWLCSVCCFNGERIQGERCFPTAERDGRAG